MPINHKFYMYKRRSLRILLMFAMVFSWHCVLCQSSSFELGISGGVLLEGSELSTTYGTTLGADVHYNFKDNKQFSYFLKAGVFRDLDGIGAALTGLDLGVGAKYNLLKLRKQFVYLSLAAGGLYLNEAFSTQLIEGVTTSTHHQFGLKAKFSIGYPITKRINSQISIHQLHSKGTLAGLDIFYKF